MPDELYSNEKALNVQQKVLNDDRLSDNAKLMFCRLNCNESFRFGWIVYDPTWTKTDRKNFSELEAKGYIYVKDVKAGGVGLMLSTSPN